MYLTSMTVEGIRPIDNLRIDFDFREAAGWHVVIGPNGSGKSTLVRALALAMLGERDVDASRVSLDRWMRPGAARSRVHVVVRAPVARTTRTRGRPGARMETLEWTTDLLPDRAGTVVSHKVAAAHVDRMPWNVVGGLFSAALGPLRRLSGGDKENEALFLRRRRLGAHLSALDDGVALVEAERWLREMHVEELEAERDLRAAFEAALADMLAGYLEKRRIDEVPSKGRSRARFQVEAIEAALGGIERRINGRMASGAVKVVALAAAERNDIRETDGRVLADTDVEIDSLSKRIVRFVNSSGFLFDKVKIVEIRKEQITVGTEDGLRLGLDQLSDGYRSVIGLGFELLRLMLAEYGLDAFQRGLNERDGIVNLPGVVAIDEVEAHLHPPWQEEIGEWLQRCFPRVQFIVTTHSPIVCRPIADPDRLVRGSVWLLSSPDRVGSGIERITGERLLRLVYGDILTAVGTDAFGPNVERSEAASDKVGRLAVLNRREIRGLLDDAERSELHGLRGIFASQPTILPE